MKADVRAGVVVSAVVAAAVFASSFAYEFAVGYSWPEQALPKASPEDWDYELAWDSQGDLHLAYLGEYEGRYALIYGELVDFRWELTCVSQVREDHQGVSLALDSEDNVYLCTSLWSDIHLTDIGPHVLFAANAGGSWEVETVNTTDYCAGAEVAVDGDDDVHLFYGTDVVSNSNSNRSAVIVDMLLTDDGWESTVLKDGGEGVGWLWIHDLEVRPDGDVGLLYSCFLSDVFTSYWRSYAHLNYSVVSDGALVDSTVVESLVDYEGEISMCHGPSGTPYVCTYATDREPYRLCYFTHADGAWTRTDVGYAGNGYLRGVCVAVDSEDKLHFGYFTAYHDDTSVNHTARYCTNVDGEWKVIVLHEGDGGDDGIEVALDSDGDIHAVYSGEVAFEEGGQMDTTVYVTSDLDPDRHFADAFVSALRAAGAFAVMTGVVLLVARRRRRREEATEVLLH